MQEILTSHYFNIVVKQLNLNSKQTYAYLPTEDSYWSSAFSVWELSDDDFEILKNFYTTDEVWNKEFPFIWWRYATGSNCYCYYKEKIIVNNKPIWAWLRKLDENHCCPISYKNILAYCVEELDASTPTNVNAVCVDIAKMNNMKLSELFKKYMV